jgi:hypothetical protein
LAIDGPEAAPPRGLPCEGDGQQRADEQRHRTCADGECQRVHQGVAHQRIDGDSEERLATALECGDYQRTER